MSTETYTFWLVDVLAHDGSSEITLRYSDVGYTTRPGDTPANTAFAPRLTDPGSLSRTIFSSGTTRGGVEVGYGRVVLENSDGALAALRGYGWGRRIRIWSMTAAVGNDPNRVSFANAVRQFSGVVSHVEADYDTISLVIRDELGLLDVPLQEARFAGTSTGPTGVEGNANFQGQVKPMAFGAVIRNVSIPLVNASKETRGWNFDRAGNPRPSASVDALRNAGATYVLSGTDHGDQAALFGATVTTANADTCLAESLLRTSGGVTGELTADITVAPEHTNEFEFGDSLASAYGSLDLGLDRHQVAVTAGQAAAPDGLGQMDLVTPSASLDVHYFQARRGSIGAAVGYRLFGAVFVRAAGGRYVRFEVRADTTGHGGAVLVDLSDGSTVSASAMGAGSVVAAKVEDYGAGTYRIELVADTTAASSALGGIVQLYLLDASQNLSHGDSSQTVYAWGLQFHDDTAKILPYIPTDGLKTTLRCEATAARVAEAILAEHGHGIEPDSLLALDARNNAPVGAYFDSQITVLAAVQQVLESVGAYLIATASGTFRVGRFEAPSGTSRKAVTEDIMLDGDGQALTLLPTDDDGTGIPAYRLTVSYHRNWTEQDPDALAGSVGQDGRVLYSRRSLEVVAEDLSVRTKHPKAREVRVETLLNSGSDAVAEAVRRVAFEKSEKTRFRVPLPAGQAVWDSDNNTPLDIGDRVTVVSDRFGFSTATDFVVIGADKLFGDGSVVLDVVNSSEW